MTRPAEDLPTTGCRVSGVLHCNLNVADLATSTAAYEALGLTVRMRSTSIGADSSVLGLNELTDSDTVFLYDHRGGRGAPAVELVQWLRPVVVGAAVGAGQVGLQALGFRVPQGALGDDAGAHSDSDPDGVTRLFCPAPVTATEFAFVRLGCVDAEATTRCYTALGFVPAPDRPSVLRLDGGPPFEVHLVAVDGGAAPSAPYHRGAFRLATAVPDVRAAVDGVDALGFRVVSQPTYTALPGTKLGGLWVAAFLDPNGVMIEFVERVIG